ncbi:MAG: hypothetical protein ACRDOI_35945 [Trebonia sp.]
MEGFESALRLHAHKPGTLVALADNPYGLTDGYIVSLSHLIREAAIYAILTGSEQVDEPALDSVELDYAAVEEAREQWQSRQKDKNLKK